MRGSIGTGFKAPTVPQLSASPQPFGVTSEPYACTPALQAIATSLGAVCRGGNVQYDVIAGGNESLEPEKSRQATLGLRFEPNSNFSVGADLWHVQIRDAIGQITEDVAFANPALYDTWTTQIDNQSQINYIALNQGNVNLGKEFYTGIDFDLVGRFDTPLGRLSNQLLMTYMIREAKQLLPGGPYYSAIGNNNDALGSVTFRWQGRLSSTLETGNWKHTGVVNFKSGYKDSLATVEVLDNSGNPTGEFVDVQLDIKRMFTLDWQSQWQLNKNFALTLGVLNVFDRRPPLSLTPGGLNKGQMYGYDDRYYDSRGRTYYANASFTF
jgi:iron complex outermembrane recepter protein